MELMMKMRSLPFHWAVVFLISSCFFSFSPIAASFPLNNFPWPVASPQTFPLGNFTVSIELSRENPFQQPQISHWGTSGQEKRGKSSLSSWQYNYNMANMDYIPKQLELDIRKQYKRQVREENSIPSKDFLGNFTLLSILMRVQNETQQTNRGNAGNSPIYSVGPSQLVYLTGICFQGDEYSCDWNITGQLNNPDYLLISSEDSPDSLLGVEDPRIITLDGNLLIFYTAVEKSLENPQDAQAHLSLKFCKDFPSKTTWAAFKQCFQSLGNIINKKYWSKSGAFLTVPYSMEEEIPYWKANGLSIEENGNSSFPGNSSSSSVYYLFYGDSSIFTAVTADLMNYNNLVNGTTGERHEFISPRPGFFDNALVESGPEPLSIGDGYFLFLYNSGGFVNRSNPKPNWNIQYNLGFVVFHESKPLEILHRSPVPLFSPELDWELCTTGEWADRCLTPMVIFVEGWKFVGSFTQGSQRIVEFLVFYQGGDSAMGMAKLSVKIDENPING